MQSKIKSLPIIREVYALREQLDQLIRDYRRDLDEQRQSQESFLAQYRTDLTQQTANAESFTNKLRDEALHRIKELEQETATLRNRLEKLSSRASLADAVEWDQFYVDFENAFRGSSADIRARQEAYLKYLEPLKEISQEKPILDIGCGRGEFLQLLRERGFGVRGVELNHKMAEETQKLGIECVVQDAILYLKDFRDESFAAITAFQVVEHIPFENLMFLLREVRRTLVHKGKGIFETPNPENMVVGACNFYNDLSHMNPIPPTALHFCCDWIGFKNIEVVRLAPMKPAPKHADPDVNEVLKRFACEQDYAIIGEKW